MISVGRDLYPTAIETMSDNFCASSDAPQKT
jgi:hypothetical protein